MKHFVTFAFSNGTALSMPAKVQKGKITVPSIAERGAVGIEKWIERIQKAETIRELQKIYSDFDWVRKTYAPDVYWRVIVPTVALRKGDLEPKTVETDGSSVLSAAE